MGELPATSPKPMAAANPVSAKQVAMMRAGMAEYSFTHLESVSIPFGNGDSKADPMVCEGPKGKYLKKNLRTPSEQAT